MSVVAPSPKVPTATYRVQLRSGLTFDELQGLVDYFAELGISDLYLSPIVLAESGSSHAYATIDYGKIDPRVGSLESLGSLGAALDARGMGLLLDIVPNHMCASPGENPWWHDVLELGQQSPFAKYFDIDWSPPDPELDGKVLAPLLSDDQEDALLDLLVVTLRETGEGGLGVECGDVRLPLSLPSWKAILEPLGAMDPEPESVELRESLVELAALGRGSGSGNGNANGNGETGATASVLSTREWETKERLKEKIVGIVMASGSLRAAAATACAEWSSDPLRLHSLLARQAYRLAPWRQSGARLNYRRFFDIDSLVRLRVEDDEVFQKVHQLPFALAEKGVVRGLRVDHVDGLRDPRAYLEKLPRSTYVVVEKILEQDERLPPEWPVAGTTGYEVLNRIHRLFVDPSGERELEKLFAELTESSDTYEDVVFESKKLVVRESFSGEVDALARSFLPFLDEVAVSDEESASLSEVASSLENLVASFPVYRTYIATDPASISDWDRRVIESAAAAAKRRDPGDRLVGRLAAILTLREPEPLSSRRRGERHELALRFQQWTGAVMAKGVEDTAFYRYFPLLSLNEVGGGPVDMPEETPGEIDDALARFHQRNRERVEVHDMGLTASSTHDTKRDEDVRARISVLSELPSEWRDALSHWRRLNRRHRQSLPHDREAPDAAEEYFLYQTLLGTWPMEPLDEESHRRYVERVQLCMNKALREAKRNTSWTKPDLPYEKKVSNFVSRILDPQTGFRFIERFSRFEAQTRSAGLWSALAQLTLKATIPGVPDFYQGTEIHAFRLVDPDNRAPVDFERRRALLDEIDAAIRSEGRAALVARLAQRLEDGRLKLFLTRELLRFRRAHRELFLEGGYRPILPQGERADHVVAFARTLGATEVVVAVGRFFGSLESPPAGESAWKDTRVKLEASSPGEYRDALTDRVVGTKAAPGGGASEHYLPLSRVFSTFPLAVLHSERGDPRGVSS